MKVFLSWSGEKSHQIASLFSDWIPCVIQAVEPWISSKDIDRGSIWFNEIFEQLKDTNFGIVFVTKENQDKPWLLFESGALSKGLSESRICTVLIDLNVRDIDSGSPLTQLNHTALNKDSVLALIKTINKHLDEGAVQEKHLEKSFLALWGDFEQKIKEVNSTKPSAEENSRKDADVLNDILENVLNINKKVSRPSQRLTGEFIPKLKAEELVKKLLILELDRDQIRNIGKDIIPSKWLDDHLNDIFNTPKIDPSDSQL